MHPQRAEITQLLNAWCKGDQDALERLAPAVESELHELARGYLSKEAADNTLQPTALVNEAYLRLIEWNAVEWQNRTHFYAVAAKIMRRVLVNQAVARNRRKRGGSAILVSLAEAGAAPDRSAEVIAVDEALKSLAKFDDRKSRIVELRFFGGLNAEETAEVLGISARTVHREWDLARAWLFRELRGRT
ncbi:MAG: sigma-70 family RNA polymerase sigma factor [Acidobacteriaceae bacterium]|nr:sigma-70 family RNA polymerase sigma factor [Acidobacteriaceae bacterium]